MHLVSRSNWFRLSLLAWSFFIIPGLIFVNSASPAEDNQMALPFSEGEKLSFDIYRGFLKVGETVMGAMPNSVFQRKPVRHFRIETRTTPLIELVYKVRSRIEAFTALDECTDS
jgi:hypothetical protein